jgi:phage terminase large subunit GpA-like protein
VNVNALVAATMPTFAPPPDLTVSEWAEHHRRLPASSASSGARWNNASTPYLVEIQDAACDPSVRKLVVMGASQTGKSESLHNVVGYWMQHDPSTVLWLMPSFEDAKRRSRGALADMIRSTPSLRTIVRGRRAPRGTHEHESTLLEKVYPGGSLILAGSGTPNSFAGVSARRAIADEFERFAELEEGAPEVLLTNRTSAFYDGFVCFISTPLLVDGKIHAQFKLTDQRRYVLRCEACGHETFTAWQDATRFHVTYRDKDPDSARLACPSCEVAHDEAARRRMVAAGRWQATAEPIDETARGYHLPATISTLGDVTLARLVSKWLAARASGPAALMSFVTTVLAEPWEDRGARVEPHALAARLEHYGDGIDAPTGVICLTAGVDVQIDRFEVQVIGWGRGAEGWVVDAHVVPGDPTSPDVQAALLAALDERYAHASGLRLPIVATCVDAGYLPERVAHALAARRPRRLFAVKGVGGRFGEPSILKFDPRQPPATLNVDGLKLETALGLELAAPGPGYLHLSRRCCDEEYLAQLCAEHRETKRRNGVATMVWVEDRPRNEALDTAVYARAALKLLTRLSGVRSEDSMLAKMAERLRSGRDA